MARTGRVRQGVALHGKAGKEWIGKNREGLARIGRDLHGSVRQARIGPSGVWLALVG